jgi:two-component system CheB/CheR fusion protein
MRDKPTQKDLINKVRELELLLMAKESEVQHIKNIFFSHINHEIRTPLNSIIGFSNLLADESLTKDQRDLYLEYINNSSEQFLTLIENLIDISLLESGKMELHEGVCRLYEMFDELYHNFDKLKHKKGKHSLALLVNREISDKNFAFITDKFRLEQIMSNLVENAIKFTEKGVIEFGYAFKNKDSLQFFVKDMGRGIDKARYNNIFNSFRRSPDVQTLQVGGTGMGLAITKGLVKLMGGDIWVEPNIRKGSIFKFSLPLKTPTDENIKRLEEEKMKFNYHINNSNTAF